MGFDFAGTYTKLVEHALIAYEFGGRHATVTFSPHGTDTLVSVRFDPETEYPLDQQRDGWQAILDNFAGHVATTRQR